jgi:hypothetical protein
MRDRIFSLNNTKGGLEAHRSHKVAVYLYPMARKVVSSFHRSIG